MKNLTFKLTLLAILTFSFSNAFSQVKNDTTATNQKVIVKMKNGEEYIGNIIKQDEKVLVLQSKNGEIKLFVSKIASIEEYTYTGRFLFPSSHQTRYFFGPSAIPLEKGTGYYHNVYVLGNFINLGIADNVSIGGGIEFISTFIGHPIFFLTPKVGFQIADNAYLGGGVIFAGIAGETTAVLGYGVSTFGTSETNVTVGFGVGRFGDGKGQALMVSGTRRISNSLALLSENYVFFDNGSRYVHGIQGIRILSKSNSFDFGFILSSEFDSELPTLPYVAYSRSF